jgi:DNA-binding transcriptional LysR family regulator
VLYRTAHDVFTKLAAAKARLMDSREKPTGELRITTTVGLGSIWLTPRIKEFMELYPEIQVQLLLEDEELDLSMREADVAIRLRRPTQPDLIQRKLFTVHHHIFASVDYVKKHGIPKSVEELDKHKILIFGTAANYLSNLSMLQSAGRADGDPRPVALRVNNAYGLRRAVQAGAGIAILADYLVAPDMNLVQIDLSIETPEYETYFVYPEELKETKRITAFRDFIVAKAREWSF